MNDLHLLTPWTVADALIEARRWLAAKTMDISGYRGAYVSGSVARMADDDTVPSGSDVDLMVVGDGEGYLGKAVRDGIVVEGTLLPAVTVLDADAVLRDYHLAPGLVNAHILDDPHGELARVKTAATARYADGETILARLDHAEGRARATLDAVADARTDAERLIRWQFGVGQIAHMLLVGALENPTVRRRYIAVAEVLDRYDESIAYERLLRLAHVNRLRVPAVEALVRDLDALLMLAGPLADGSDWRFASDIGTPMRRVILDGIRAMIRDGWHREAMFWIVATWCRCIQLLGDEAPQLLASRPHLHAARLRDVLHVASAGELDVAVGEAREAIGHFRELAEAIAERSAFP